MTKQKTSSKTLNISLWIAQVILAVMFIMAGAMKSMQPIDELVKMGMTWTESNPALVRFIGISELLGGIGLILPAALRIKPFLTTWAAAGLLVVMVLAFGFHIIQGDTVQQTMPSALLGLIAAFIAWGRFKKFSNN